MYAFFEVHSVYQNKSKRDPFMPTGPLKRAIVRQFGRPILNKSDAMDLETAIFESTGELVSYNTIRRFFGLAQGGEPRPSVLNIYARYIGFPSYRDFHQSSERHAFYNLWTQTLSKKAWTQTERDELVLAALQEDRQAQSVLLYILHETFSDAPYDEWIPWLQSPAWNANEESNGVKMFFTNSLGQLLRRRVQSVQEAEAFIAIPEIVEWAVHFFTDYSTLQGGYFMYVIHALHDRIGGDIYTHGMLSMRFFFLGDYSSALPHLDAIIAEGYDANRYPILNSRYLASQYLAHWIRQEPLDGHILETFADAFDSAPRHMHHLLGMEAFPIMAVLGYGEDVLQIAGQFKAFEAERIHWSASLDLDMTRIALMIAYADQGNFQRFLEMETLIQPENWYVSYRDYQQSLYAFAEIRMGRSTPKFHSALNRFPGLKALSGRAK